MTCLAGVYGAFYLGMETRRVCCMVNSHNISKRLFPDHVAFIVAKTSLLIALLIVAVSIFIPLFNAAIQYELIFATPILGYNHIIDFGSEESAVSYFLYLLEISTAVFFLVAFVLTRRHFFLFFAILYLVIFFDDYLQIHERLGGLLVRNFRLIIVFGLREQDVGELLAWVTMAVCILPLGVTSFKKLEESDRFYCLAVASSFALLLVCGVFLDMVHTQTDGLISHAVGILEDGGELVAVALTFGLGFSGAKQGITFR
jgi:hypothetical protein